MVLLELLVSILSLDRIQGLNVDVCEFATPNKYLGFFFTDRGSGNVEPYGSVDRNNTEECRHLCRVRDICFAVSFDGVNTCAFYNTSDITINSDDQKTFYLWKRCDWTLAIQPSDGRCKGMFIRYYDRAIMMVKSFLVLKSIENTPPKNCNAQCLQHPLCNAVNYQLSSSYCDLLELWPEQYIKETVLPGTDLYRWTCVPNFVEELELPNIPSQPNIYKCSGYWNVSSRNATIVHATTSGVYFSTQSYQVCLSECNAHPHCNYALFNVTHNMCMLLYTERSDPNKNLQRLTFIEFKWVCVKNDARIPQMNKKEINYESKNLSCVTLVTNANVYIAKDACGYLPLKEDFSNCQSTSVTREWMVIDQCTTNKSFRRFPSQFNRLIINGTYLYNISRIFNGLTFLWMAHFDDSIFANASFMECRRFDGARNKDSIEDADITSRPQWYAFPPQGSINPYKQTPVHIVLTASQKPLYGCRTKDACTNILRKLQILYFSGAGNTERFSDIPYNFMVDEGGNIYEGRGWANQCAAVLDYNPTSLCFAFIGRFNVMRPPIKFLNSLKGLIEFAAKKGYVTKDYILYIHQDVTRNKIYPNYANIIKNWYRYRGFLPKDCAAVKSQSVIVSGLLILLISVVVMIIRRWLNHYKDCDRCSFLHSVPFKIIYPQQYPTAPIGILGIRGCSLSSSYCIITERRTLFGSNLCRTLVFFPKLWVHYRLLKTYSSICYVNDLGKFMKTFSNFRPTFAIYEGSLVIKRTGVPEDLYIILCCTLENSYRLFEGLTSNNLCICQYFTVEHPSCSEIEMEIG